MSTGQISDGCRCPPADGNLFQLATRADGSHPRVEGQPLTVVREKRLPGTLRAVDSASLELDARK